MAQQPKGQLISKANFHFISFGPILYFCPRPLYQIKRTIQIITLDDKQSLISMLMSHYFYDLAHLRG